MIEWADRRAWTAPSPAGARPLSPETLLAKVSAARPGAAPTGDHAARGSPGARDHHARRQQGAAGRSLHRRRHRRAARRPALVLPDDDGVASLPGAEGASRATGKAITGAANLVFLFIVVSGMYLWLPSIWKWIQFKNVMWFRRGLRQGARLQLAQRHRLLVGHAARDRRGWRGADLLSVGEQSGLPHRWRHAAGRHPLRSGRPANAVSRPSAASRPPLTDGLDASWTHGEQQIPGVAHDRPRGWRRSPKAPIVFTVDEGYGGQPQKRAHAHRRSRHGARSEGRDLRRVSAQGAASAFVAALRAHGRNLWPDRADRLPASRRPAAPCSSTPASPWRCAVWPPGSSGAVSRRRGVRKRRRSSGAAVRLSAVALLISVRRVLVPHVRSSHSYPPRKRKKGRYRLFATSALLVSTALGGKAAVARASNPSRRSPGPPRPSASTSRPVNSTWC